MTLDFNHIQKHGFLRAAILEMIKTYRYRTAREISNALKVETIRKIEVELTTLHNERVIEYILNSQGKKLAFIL